MGIVEATGPSGTKGHIYIYIYVSTNTLTQPVYILDQPVYILVENQPIRKLDRV